MPSTNNHALDIHAGYSSTLSSQDQFGVLNPFVPPGHHAFLDLDTGQMNAVLDSVPSLSVDTSQFVEGSQYFDLDFGAMNALPGADQPVYPFRTQDEYSPSHSPSLDRGHINCFFSSESAESLSSDKITSPIHYQNHEQRINI